MAKDNCLKIPKIYQKLFSTYSFIKIFAIEVSAFLKKLFPKYTKVANYYSLVLGHPFV